MDTDEVKGWGRARHIGAYRPSRKEPMMKRTLCALATILLFWPALAPAQKFTSAPPVLAPPSLVEQIGIDQNLDAQVPLDLTFRDETGATVRLGEYVRDKPVVLSLVYYNCPMLCTEVLNGMKGVFRHIPMVIGKDFDVVTVSIDPTEDPALAAGKKEKYLEGYEHPEGASGWHFLTGDEQQIRALASVVGFRYVYDEQTKQYAHAAGIMVLTPGGRVARYLYGVDYLIKDMRLALVEASHNTIGSPIDQVLLLCYHYDPATGKYGLVVMNLLKITGAITMLTLGGFITVMLRRDRKKRLSQQTRG
jgi:protein SCO1